MSTTTLISRGHNCLRFSRKLPASPPAVFALFADPVLLPQWWSPPECPIVESTLDFRAGGVWFYKIHSVRADEYHYSRAVFREIENDARILFVETSANAAGLPTEERAAALTTVTLASLDQGTQLEVVVEYDTREAMDAALGRGVTLGLSRALDQLATIVTTQRTQE